MAFDRTVDFSIEQVVALLTGKISLQALNSRAPSVRRYYTTMFNSNDFWNSGAVSRYHQQLIQALRSGELEALDSQVLVNPSSGKATEGEQAIAQDALTDQHQISNKTRIGKKALRHWVASHREAHSFLMNHTESSIARGEGWDAGKQAFLEAEGFGEHQPALPIRQSDSVSIETQDSRDLSSELAEIQSLLNGEHEFQAEELRVALQAWFEVSSAYRKTGLSGDPSSALKKWVGAHLDSSNEYQVIRLAGIANWKHSAPKLRLVQ